MVLTKISALRDPIDIEVISGFMPTYISFDFMPLSPRYFGEADACLLSRVSPRIRRVGRFADQDPLRIVSIAGKYSLTTVQLDGLESASDCELLSGEGLEVLKSITDENISQIDEFEGVCNRFVFRLVDNSVLASYRGRTPFMVETCDLGFSVSHPLFCGVDCGQQGFERSVGCKDLSLVERYLHSYRD